MNSVVWERTMGDGWRVSVTYDTEFGVYRISAEGPGIFYAASASTLDVAASEGERWVRETRCALSARP